ncbi:hypothetical protein ACLOJK_037604 [Asimina triloba]
MQGKLMELTTFAACFDFTAAHGRCSVPNVKKKMKTHRPLESNAARSDLKERNLVQHLSGVILIEFPLQRQILLTRLKSFFDLESRHHLVEIDLSNAAEMSDVGAAAISRAQNLERLWLLRCKKVTDPGIGCITGHRWQYSFLFLFFFFFLSMMIMLMMAATIKKQAVAACQCSPPPLCLI